MRSLSAFKGGFDVLMTEVGYNCKKVMENRDRGNVESGSG